MKVAVLTYGRLKAPAGHSSVSEFIDASEAVFSIAERSEGFIWRYVADENEETMAHYEKFARDRRVSMTLSVWESQDAVRRYTFNTLHEKFWKKRADWFAPQEGANMVMWHVPGGHRPDYDEAMQRLKHFNTHGSSDYAFRWQDAQAEAEV